MLSNKGYGSGMISARYLGMKDWFSTIISKLLSNMYLWCHLVSIRNCFICFSILFVSGSRLRLPNICCVLILVVGDDEFERFNKL